MLSVNQRRRPQYDGMCAISWRTVTPQAPAASGWDRSAFTCQIGKKSSHRSGPLSAWGANRSSKTYAGARYRGTGSDPARQASPIEIHIPARSGEGSNRPWIDQGAGLANTTPDPRSMHIPGLTAPTPRAAAVRRASPTGCRLSIPGLGGFGRNLTGYSGPS